MRLRWRDGAADVSQLPTRLVPVPAHPRNPDSRRFISPNKLYQTKRNFPHLFAQLQTPASRPLARTCGAPPPSLAPRDRGSLPVPVHKPFVARSPMEAVDGDRDNKMSNKRKAVDEPERHEEEEDSEDEPRVRAKRPRCRRRSRSEPRNTGSDSSQKREALRRLFGWFYLQDGVHFEGDDDNYLSDNDENDDPCYVEDPLLLDSVPECMDPEQLGFLLCAQETLRYLRQSGMSVRHSVYMSLRTRFVKAIKDLGIA